MQELQTKSKRNSILELFRLFASLWVMYYHGITLITKTSAFSNGRIAVDFFFLLSGFFFLYSYKREDDKSTVKGCLSFVWKRFKPLSITFGICMIFSLIYYFQFYEGFGHASIFGYLWYVPHLMFVFAFYFLLKRIIKFDKFFYIITALVSAICYVLMLTYVVDLGIFRGLAGVGFGILISTIPKLSFKNSNILAIVITSLLFVAITLIAIFYPGKEIQDPICLLVLFPAIIYFASNINCSVDIINKICSISFGLYAYQTVTRVLKENGIVTIGWQMFLIVLSLAIVDAVLKALFKRKQKEDLVNV